MYLKIENGRAIVDCYAMALYVDHEFTEAAYRNLPYYSIIGTKVQFLGIGMMRFFGNETEMKNPDSVKAHPLGIPMLIMSEPSEIDAGNVRFSRTGPLRKCAILTYYKGDAILTSTEAIKNSDAAMMVLSRLEQGKLDYLTPEVSVGILRDTQDFNKVGFRIPSEEEEIFVAERYRDPDNPTRKYRYHEGKIKDPTNMVSYNARVEMHQGSSFSGLMGEDVQQGLILACNREEEGIRVPQTSFEALIRGEDMTSWAERDYTTKAMDTSTDLGVPSEEEVYSDEE